MVCVCVGWGSAGLSILFLLIFFYFEFKVRFYVECSGITVKVSIKPQLGIT